MVLTRRLFLTGVAGFTALLTKPRIRTGTYSDSYSNTY